MEVNWSSWETNPTFWDPKTTTPYIDWAEQFFTGLADDDVRKKFELASFERFPRFGTEGLPGLADIAAAAPEAMGGPGGFLGPSNPVSLRIPKETKNPNFDKRQPWVPNLSGLAASPDADAVILGVIDGGIALDHRRFRDVNGGTRVLASWQQGAEYGGGTDRNLPFGDEKFQHEIDGLLANHTPEAFNRAIGLVDFKNVYGTRSLGLRGSHGTHVLDLAGGMDTSDPRATIAKRPIITVNLPDRRTVGLSGAFLEYFVAYAIHRVVDISDQLWLQARYTPTNGIKGFPIVINFSFGKQAGSRDAQTVFVDVISRLNRDRETGNRFGDPTNSRWSRVHLVLPAGNDNLTRTNASLPRPRREQIRSLRWQVQPEDQTSNFVEIWSPRLTGDNVYIDQLMNGRASVPLAIDACPMGGNLNPLGGYHGRYIELKNAAGGVAARLYCEVVKYSGRQGGPSYRVRYVLCAAPTLSGSDDKIVAPAGAWQIGVISQDLQFAQGERVRFSIQSDQAPHELGLTSRRSYFDDETYLRRNMAGRAVDTYSYEQPYGRSPRVRPVLQDTARIVKRRGTINALGASSYVVLVAGHRRSDGRPAGYSGSGAQQILPLLSAVTDDSPSAFGILSAGSVDGSRVALRGTSFAAAYVSNCAVEILAQAGNPHVINLSASLSAMMPPLHPAYGLTAKQKAGGGRLDGLPQRRTDAP